MKQDGEIRPATAANTRPDVPRDGTVSRLIAALNHAGLRYCHWKSNIRLPDSLRGAEDLDLLVDREDAAEFEAALLRTGFKAAVSRGGMSHPGVFHAFALNADGTGLVHVHAYYRIVTGDSLVKSYRLPIERDLIDGGHSFGGVPVPSPEAELALFALRILLKHLHLVEIVMVGRGYQTIVEELDWLQGRADFGRAAQIWQSWFPSQDVPALDVAIAAIAAPKARLRRLILGSKLARALRGRRRIGVFAAGIERWRRVARMAMGRFHRKRDLVPRTGGLVVALVGPKAVGKSTLGAEIANRLGGELDVRRVHVGKPPPTALSLVPFLLLPIARRLLKSERAGEYEKPERRREGRYSLLYILRMTLVAHDRRALIRRCWKDAASGTIVVADRYPSETRGAIDGRCFDDETIAACRHPLKRWLMQRERAFYQGLSRPDLVLRLTASRETTVKRDATRVKPGGPDADAVIRRWDRETALAFGDVRCVTIGTDRPIETSAAEVTRAVWDAI